MQIFQKRKWVYAFTGMCLIFAGMCLYWTFRELPEEVRKTAHILEINEFRSQLAEKLGPALLQNQRLSEVELQLNDEDTKVSVEYTIDEDLQKAGDKLLKSYKPDYGA